MKKNLSLDEKVLLAGYDLEIEDKSPFSAEDLVISSWKKYPDAFSLQGYLEYPDSNRVFSKIMGDKGLRGRGWMLKVGEKLYQLSEAGKMYAVTILENQSITPSRSTLTRQQQDILHRLLQSKAVQKIKNNLSEDIIFMDACSFWDISPRSTANTLIARLESCQSILNLVEKIIVENNTLAFVHGQIAVTKEDITLLNETNIFLQSRYHEELKIISKRKDDRKLV